MRLSISNIAWNVSEDEEIAQLLSRYRVDAIDVAPGKYFDDPKTADAGEIERVRCWWADRGLEITGMQALLFGTTGLNIFGGPDSQQAMLRHLDGVCRVGSILGASRLVFGSPKNRDCSGLTEQRADAVAIEFFRRLGDMAQNHGVFVCLEPNPTQYGCNFMTGSEDTARIVRASEHPAVRMQLDTGAVTLNKENPKSLIHRHADIIGHIHVSEPDLVTLGDGGVKHDEFAQEIFAKLPDHVLAIEMLAAQNEPHLSAIERALKTAIANYRPATNGGDNPC